jgi:predicted phage terminase large subunit-like protein
MPEKKQIAPQEGPQEDFLSCPADICIYGGAAGSGKTYAELLEPLHYITSVPGFNAICFRRTTPMIRSGGGLWDESLKLYSGRAEPKETTLEWLFPCPGAKNPNRLKFAHLEYEKNALDYQGAQLCLIQFDELTHFTEYQFWYLLSRNRSVCGVKPYIRATCNPDPDSWLIVGPDGWGSGPLGWWIDHKTGYPIKERSGVIRHFIRINNQLIWSDYPDELTDLHPESLPQSFTFIAATLEDNPALTAKDPGYRGRLLAMNDVDMERLLKGNWKIRPAAGNVFKRAYFRSLVSEHVLAQMQWIYKIGSWDTAYEIEDPEKPKPRNKNKQDSGPDYSVYTLWGINKQGYFLIDYYKERLEYPDLLQKALFFYMRDRPNTLLIEKKASGISLIQSLKACNIPVPVEQFPPKGVDLGSKVDRAFQAAPFFKAGLVHLPATAFWLHDYIEEMVAFPDAAHDDSVDSTSQAIIWHSQGGFSGGGKRAVQVLEDDYYI